MTSTLITYIQELIELPCSDYAIGITDNLNKFAKNTGRGGIVVLDYHNEWITLQAYNHFVNQGMTGHKHIGYRTRYLYLYRLDGQDIKGVI